MSSWATIHSANWAASQPGQTDGRLQTHAAWPPYRLPSTDTPEVSDRLYQPSCEPVSRSGLALQPFSGSQAFEINSSRSLAPVAPALQSTTSHIPIHAPLKSSSAYNVSQGANDASAEQQSNVDETNAKSELYHMAHLSFPRTWVHLWDRAPLREAETLLSTVCAVC